MSYILSHEAYKKGLWDKNDPPECLEGTNEEVVIAHNKVLGTAWAGMQKDINLIVKINDTLVRDVEELRKAKAALEKKLQIRDNKIREQGEYIKRLEKSA